MLQVVKHQLWIVLAAGVVLFTNLGVPRLWDEDEPKNATCAREMLSRGDWVVPTFNHELRTDKPILIYWLMMTSYEVFGDNEFGARFCSAALAIGTALLTYHIGRLLFRPEVGLWGGLIMATALMFDVAGRAATPDSTLIFFVTLSLLMFVKGIHASNTLPRSPESASRRLADLVPQRWGYFAGMYAAMSLATLAKGPVGVLLPTAIIGLYLLFMGDEARHDVWNDSATTVRGSKALHGLSRKLLGNFPAATWAMRPLTLIAVFCVVALPWYLCVYFKTDGEWTDGFLLKHNLDRFRGPMEGHKGPFFYYLPAIMFGFFPWSIFLPASIGTLVARIHQRHVWRPGQILLACWVCVYLVVFSCSGTKLPSYVLPAYPALALMVGAFLDRWICETASVRGWWLRVSFGWLGAVGVGLIVAPLVSKRMLPGEAVLGLAGAIPIIGALVALWFSEHAQPRRATIVTCVTAVLLGVGLFGFGAVRVSQHQNSESLIAAAREVSGGKPQIATFDYNAPSVVFYAKDRVDQINTPAEVREYFAGSDNRFLILPAQHLEELKDVLPAGVEVISRQPRFLRVHHDARDELVLLGRAANNATASRQHKVN